jgi:hypothetical protein
MSQQQKTQPDAPAPYRGLEGDPGRCRYCGDTYLQWVTRDGKRSLVKWSEDGNGDLHLCLKKEPR